MSEEQTHKAGTIKVDHHDGCAHIVVSNPARKNALSLSMWQALASHVTTADADPTVRLITLRGENGTFVSGADISEFAETRSDAEKANAYEAVNAAAFASLRKAKTPTLALIEGACFGGGVGLAAACDLRIADKDARFAVPAAKLGLAYPMEGVADLVQLIGPARTRLLFYTANPISADEALTYGFLEAVYELAEFGAKAEYLITTILSRAPLTQRAAKLAVQATHDETAQAHAVEAASACFDSTDYTEGWQAFLEKRKPRFSGR